MRKDILLHRRLIEPALRALDEKRAVYFFDLVERVERDSRTDAVANLVFLTLKESIPVLPTLIEPEVVVEELFKFLNEHRTSLAHRIHSARFIVDPSFIRPMIMLFVGQVTDLVWARVDAGEITPDGDKVWRMEWPYADTEEFPYQSLEEQDAQDQKEAFEAAAEVDLIERLTKLVDDSSTSLPTHEDLLDRLSGDKKLN